MDLYDVICCECAFIGCIINLIVSRAQRILVTIGNHAISGSLVSLPHPLVVMKKEIAEQSLPFATSPLKSQDVPLQSTASHVDGTVGSGTAYRVEAVVRKKIDFKTRPRPLTK